MKLPDIDRVKSVVVVAFCVVAALGNIASYRSGMLNDGEISFNAAETIHNTQQAVEQPIVQENEVLAVGSGGDDRAVVAAVDVKQKDMPDESGGLININTATSEQLQELKGIGPSKAAAVIEYRNAYGGFSAVEEIMEVKGIGEGTFSKIKDRICVK